MAPSMWQLLIILVVVLLVFGTKRLRNLGGDLGGAIKGFKKAMDEDSDKKLEQQGGETIDVEAKTADTVNAKADSTQDDKKV